MKAQCTVNKWLKKLQSGCKTFDDQAWSDKPKAVDSETVLQAIKANLASSDRRVSGELGILQFNVVGHFHDFNKIIRNFRIVPHDTKILQNFCFILILFTAPPLRSGRI